jgi:peptidoglycan/LPS O-acetylase OafA/YrhL
MDQIKQYFAGKFRIGATLHTWSLSVEEQFALYGCSFFAF